MILCNYIITILRIISTVSMCKREHFLVLLEPKFDQTRVSYALFFFLNRPMNSSKPLLGNNTPFERSRLLLSQFSLPS